jgi:sugar phosphate isomerase/epimerase
MADIKISFSMHPRWVGQEGLEAFLAPLRNAGLSTLEFELDSHLGMWDETCKLMEQCFDLGMDLCFHAPYRLPHRIAGFSGNKRAEIVRDYQPLLDIARDWAKRTGGQKTVVFHGARGENEEHSQLYSDTHDFCLWLLGTYPVLKFALENNNPTETNVIKIGVTREEVLELVTGINSPQLGICWDMGHDYLAKREDKLAPEWLERIIHVHVHDVDPQGNDHFPLMFGKVPFARWLSALHQVGMKGIVTLELKGDNLKGWQLEEISKALTTSVKSIASEVA